MAAEVIARHQLDALRISGRARIDATGAILTRLFGGFAPDFPLHQWKGILKMKTFIVYDLIQKCPLLLANK